MDITLKAEGVKHICFAESDVRYMRDAIFYFLERMRDHAGEVPSNHFYLDASLDILERKLEEK